jgi:hypothetical protein
MVRGESTRYGESEFPVSIFRCVVWCNWRSSHCTTFLRGTADRCDPEGFRNISCRAYWKICLWQHEHKYSCSVTERAHISADTRNTWIITSLLHGLATVITGPRTPCLPCVRHMKDFVHKRKVNRPDGLIRRTVDRHTCIDDRDTLHRVPRSV